MFIFFHFTSLHFVVGNIADANEALGVILHRLHEECFSCDPIEHPCITHRIFGVQTLEQIYCIDCGSSSEPTCRESFTHLVYASELLQKAAYSTSLQQTTSFGKLLSYSLKSTSASILECPTELCRGRGIMQSHLLNNPIVLAICITWTSSQEDIATLQALLDIITEQLSTEDMFTTVLSTTSEFTPTTTTNTTTSTPSREHLYVFRGMVCYYGLHYIAIFQDHTSTSTKTYSLFDDAHIRHIGTWSAVKIECIKSHYQPVLLLYEREEQELVGTDSSTQSKLRILKCNTIVLLYIPNTLTCCNYVE